ncbi:MAG: methyl-accepting chemotaxis protein [Treponema sp.]|nr:methyl-accepting chemotaxis protein [Treponema sp.]
MPGQFFFFILGAVLAGAVVVPLLRSYRKRIEELSAQAARSAGDESGFRDNTARLAALVKESAGAVSLSGHDGPVSESDQDGNIEKIERAINENTRIITEIIDKTNSVAAIVSKMENDAAHGFTVLEKNIKKMTDIKEKNSGSINGIISLSNKVNKIRDIVRVITTITDQTKVIAFNAALEAASAGETGKRFAVVADEVNRLADDIAVLTRQIREQVEEIQNSSSSLIVYSEEGSDRIAEGYKLIKDLEDIFKGIRSSTEITSGQMQTIAVSAQQQLKSGGHIYDATSEISQRMKRFSGAAKTAALSAANLTERIRELERFLTAQDTAKQGEHGD